MFHLGAALLAALEVTLASPFAEYYGPQLPQVAVSDCPLSFELDPLHCEEFNNGQPI